MKNGNGISFWHSNWAANRSLRGAFPEAFSRENDQACNIEDAGYWERNVWIWNLPCNIEDSDFEAAVKMEEICRILDDVEPLKDREDELCWKADKSECLAVNSCYIKMDPCLTDLTQDCLTTLAIIWKYKVQPKIQFF